jgi:YD repeat-containing protein
MRRLIFSIGLFLSLSCFSQETDTYQADSIYKANKVKSRTLVIEGAFTKQTIILKYDKFGRLSAWVMTDESGIKPQTRIVFKYDNSDKLIAEDYYYGTIEGEKTKFEYDSKNRVIRKSTTYDDGKPKNETEITYEPKIVHQKEFDDEGMLTRESHEYFEFKNITNRFAGTDYSTSGQSTWDYTFKNTFNKKGQLTTRSTKEGKQTIQTREYEYNENGLLIKKTTKQDFAGPTVERYNYEFYQ